MAKTTAQSRATTIQQAGRSAGSGRHGVPAAEGGLPSPRRWRFIEPYREAKRSEGRIGLPVIISNGQPTWCWRSL